MTLIDFETLVLDRLYLLNQEIEGIKTVFRLAPDTEIGNSALPAVYPLVGQMINSIPGNSAGHITVIRQYVLRVLIKPVPQAAVSGGLDGALSLTEGALFFNRVRSVYLERPRLETDQDGRLAYMDQDLALRDTGLVARPGPGGVQYFAIDFTMDISMRDAVNIYRVS